MILSLLVFVTLCILLHLYFNWNRRHTPNLPSDYPIIGFNRYLHTTVEEVWLRVEQMTEASKKCGGVGSIRVGPFKLCIISDPEVGAKILNNCFEKDFLYDFFKCWLGNGLFSASASIWKPNRKLIMPSLSQRILDEFVDHFNSEGKRVVESLASKVNVKELDLTHDMALLNLRIILRTQMNLNLDDVNEKELDDYLYALDAFHRSIMERLVRPIMHFDVIFNIFGKSIKNEQERCVEIMDKLPKMIIENRKALTNNNNDAIMSKDKIMIDLLIELNKKGVMSDKHVKDEIHTSIFGGHDTSAGSMIFALIMIGSYPEAQQKIIDELKQVLPNKDDDVTKEHLKKMVYLEAAIKESMRMYPIMGFLGRRVDKELKFDNYSLYPGTRCLLMTHGIARHPVWGPDADEYRPERWLDPSKLPIGAAFLPFSWGKRGCIGKTYAIMSLKTTLSHILRNYKVTANHKKMVIWILDTVRPKYGHELTLEKRTDY